MFNRNIQSYPTPILYINGGRSKLYVYNYAQNSVGLHSAELRVPIVPVGSYTNETVNEIGLVGGDFGQETNVGTYTENTDNNIALVSGGFSGTVNLGTYTQETTNTTSLLIAYLRNVLVPVGSYSNEATNSLALQSASLV